MNEYNISDKYMVMSGDSVNGIQRKYYKDGWFYKIGRRESNCENLVSKVLRFSTLNPSCYVEYEKCKVNGYFACRCKNFLSEEEQFISCKVLYRIYTGKLELSEEIMRYNSPESRLQYLLYFVTSITGLLNYKSYLKTIMLLDMLILNYDRHFGNFGVIYNKSTGKYRIPPIFDNGSCLVKGRSSCTISGSYESQVTSFGYPVVSTFKINYESLNKSLGRCLDSIELNILKSQLERYKDVFKE